MSSRESAHSRTRFGVFELDLETGELRKSGVLLRLPPQPFKVLALLASHPAQLVTREELREQIWGSDTFVDFEHGLNFAIKKIRDTLGDDPETPRYIETLPRRGYRFIAPVDGATAGGPQASATDSRAGWWGALPWGVAALLIVALAVGAYFYFHRTPKLTEEDSIVLADFTNTTGDPVFDGTLRQGLSVQLEQTPFLRVISDDQVTQTLKMMEQPLDARLTPNLAREVCQRTNATVEIHGSIAALGSQYVLGLNAVNCTTGETLAREQVTAYGKEKVLAALSEATSELRSKLGESRASLEKFDAPLDEATTSSLEALQAYSRGLEASWKGDMPSAVSSLQRAVDLDPNFAEAYGLLGTLYNHAGYGDLGAKNVKKGYDLRGRASEYEKVALSGAYNLFVTQDFERAEQSFKELTTTYPRDPSPWAGLGSSVNHLGRYDQAQAAFLQLLRLNPSSFFYGLLSGTYLNQNRLEEARATVEEARAKNIEPWGASWLLYTLAFLRNDQAEMARQVAHPWTEMFPGFQEEVQGDTAAYYGHQTQARDWTHRAITSAMAARSKDLAAGYEAESAVCEDLFGDFAMARDEAKKASTLSADPDVHGGAALALALAGDRREAEKLANDLNERFPEATLVRFFHLPAIHAALALREGNAQKAKESLTIAAPYELANPGYGPPMMPVYVRGEAHLAAHDSAEAAAEFQKILDHRGLVNNSPIGALAHLGLGRAYSMQGETAKARAAYQDFLTLWKDADVDIPIFKQAKAEYAKLR